MEKNKLYLSWKWVEDQINKIGEKLEGIDELEFVTGIPRGATLPSSFIKHIKFTKDKTYKCYSFPNERPSKKWSEYRVKHNHSTF